MVGHRATNMSARRLRPWPARPPRPFRCIARSRARLPGPDSLRDAASSLFGKAAKVRPRLRREGMAATPKLFGRPFHPMEADVCQGGSRGGQTHAVVYRITSIQQAPSEDGACSAAGAEDGRIGSCVRLWPPSSCSRGPGEPLGGSVRPRGRSLRPDGVRAA